MKLLEKIRSTFTGEKICPPEHLESYKRLGQELYGVEVELAENENKKSRAYLKAAKCFQVMADALLNDAFSSKAVAPVTHDQADIWYGQITELMIAARQEHAFAGGGTIALPFPIGERMEAAGKCPLSHLKGMRRAAENIENLLAPVIARAKLEGETFKASILMYEAARTRKQAGDAIVGSISKGQKVSDESHEEAEDQYWKALSDYLVAAQGLEFPDCLAKKEKAESIRFSQQPVRCKLDSNDIWKVTSETAKKQIREAGEWYQAVEDLKEHWADHQIRPDEREYETTVETLLAQGAIREQGYWYCCPFQPTYQVTTDEVRILGKRIPRGHVFVYEYGDDGAPGEFTTRSSFGRANSRKYCED